MDLAICNMEVAEEDMEEGVYQECIEEEARDWNVDEVYGVVLDIKYKGKIEYKDDQDNLLKEEMLCGEAWVGVY